MGQFFGDYNHFREGNGSTSFAAEKTGETIFVIFKISNLYGNLYGNFKYSDPSLRRPLNHGGFQYVFFDWSALDVILSEHKYVPALESQKVD